MKHDTFPVTTQRDKFIYDEKTRILRLCAPLTPSQNVYNKWISQKKYRLIRRFRDQTLSHLKLQCLIALGPGYRRPWANKIRLDIIRCSNTYARLDPPNIIGGCKLTIDALQHIYGTKKNTYVGTGVITDDSENHLELGTVKNVPKNQWDDLGVGTWLIIHKVS